MFDHWRNGWAYRWHNTALFVLSSALFLLLLLTGAPLLMLIALLLWCDSLLVVTTGAFLSDPNRLPDF